jgi:hypothetical protein
MYDSQYQIEPSGGIMAIFAGMWLVFLAIWVFYIICQWKIFAKAGKPGWAAIVPIYNIIVLLEIIGRPLWWIVLLLIPCVNIVIMFIIMIDLAKSFGQSAGFGVGLALLGVIFMPLLAFGNYSYVGPAATPTTA